MKDYVVNAKLGTEVIILSADSEQEAINKAKDIIAEEFGYDFSKSVTFEIDRTFEPKKEG